MPSAAVSCFPRMVATSSTRALADSDIPQLLGLPKEDGWWAAGHSTVTESHVGTRDYRWKVPALQRGGRPVESGSATEAVAHPYWSTTFDAGLVGAETIDWNPVAVTVM